MKKIDRVQKKHEKRSPPAGAKPCPPEPKLGNVTTLLQGDSLSWEANVTVPIRTQNIVFIASLTLL